MKFLGHRVGKCLTFTLLTKKMINSKAFFPPPSHFAAQLQRITKRFTYCIWFSSLLLSYPFLPPLMPFYLLEVLKQLACRIFHILGLVNYFLIMSFSLLLYYWFFRLSCNCIEKLSRFRFIFVFEKSILKYSCSCMFSIVIYQEAYIVCFSHFQCCKDRFVCLHDVSLISPL